MVNIKHTFVVLAYQNSPYLELCIESVLHQSYASKVIIATTTDNDFIRRISHRYQLDVIVGSHTSIGGDFDFAIHCSDTELVTIAHQDDIYDYDYAKKVVDNYLKYPKSLIIFTDYYEIRDEKKVTTNFNLKIKRLLLIPLRFKKLSNKKFFKRWVIRFGNSICCPSVTFVRNNCPEEIFNSSYQCDIDWYAWEFLSRLDGNFIYIIDKLMGHRISLESTTTDIIKKGIRTKEDYEIYLKFWPQWIARIINKFYKSSEKSNLVKESDEDEKK